MSLITQVTELWDVAYCHHLTFSCFYCRSDVSLRTFVLLLIVLHQHLFLYASDYGSSVEY